MVGRPNTLQESLADHLRSGGWLAYTEMPLGSVQGNRGIQRVDVLALKKSYTVRLVIYEVKQSRGDFLGDINRGKYEGYMVMSHQLYFATPKGLVTKEEVPSHCGLIVRGDKGTWRTVKHASVRHPDLTDPKFFELLLACLFRGYREEVQIRQLRERVIMEDNVALSDRAKRIGWDIARRLRTLEPEREQLREVKQSIDAFLGKPTKDFNEALGTLRRLINRTLPGALNMDLALELVGIASELVGNSYSSLLQDGAKKRLADIAERVVAAEDGRLVEE